ADALFGKRSEVKDSHDRYANVEIAYLLQRMERFDGLAILTTNLRSNVDEAFTRRLDALVDFPMPEEEDRLVLWRKNLRPTLPTGGGIDLEFLARSFKLSGGNIRNIAVAAAFLAASEGEPVSMPHLIRATEREYRKLGRLCVQAEFGPWFHLVAVAPVPARPAPALSAVPQGR
ncbi:MAG: ATP-binding protein, partial [Actinomycetota bacterium]